MKDLVKRLRSQWGSPLSQEAADAIEALIEEATWRPWFAWRPIQTHSGGWVWLQRVERKWDVSLNWWGDASAHAGTDGGWVYRKCST